MEKNILQKQIKKKMQEKGFNMKSLSTAAGKNETYIRDILEGRVKSPSYSSLKAIADQLGCSVNELTDEQTSFKEDDNRGFRGFRSHDSSDIDPDLLVDATLVVKKELEKNNIKLGTAKITEIAKEACHIASHQESKMITKNLVRYLFEVKRIK